MAACKQTANHSTVKKKGWRMSFHSLEKNSLRHVHRTVPPVSSSLNSRRSLSSQ